MPRSALSVISFCHRLGKQERKRSFMGNSSNSWEPRLWAQETCAVRAEPLLLVRINASGGLILRMGAINRCLKHPLARDTPVCLLAVLGGPHSGKTFLLNHLLQGLPGLASGEGSWPRSAGSGQGFRWGANGLSRGIWMWSHPFLLGKEGRKVAVFLVDTGDVMSPELSRETRTRLCALTSMLSSYQILTASQELKDTDLEHLETFVHVAEVMGRHYGMVPIQHLDLLVRDSSHPSKAWQGHVGDVIQKSSGKYPKVQGLLQGRRARCYLLPAPGRRWVSRGHGSSGDDDAGRLRAYVADVLSAAPQHAKSRCPGYWSEGRPAARGDRRLLTGQQLAQEVKNLSGWMGRTGPSCASPDEMAAQLHDLRTVEAAKKEFEEYVRQQDAATKRIFSALRVLPDTMRNLLSAQKDTLLARHGATLLCTGREQTLEALEAELQAEAKAFMDSYTVRFCGHLAAVGGAVGAGLMGLAGGVPRGACTLPESRAPYVSLVVMSFVQPALKASPQSLGPTWGIEDIEGPILSEVQRNDASPLRKLVRDELGLEHTISDAKFVAQDEARPSSTGKWAVGLESVKLRFLFCEVLWISCRLVRIVESFF
nr:PREDICTED: RING finger protein 112 [Bos mutus]